MLDMAQIEALCRSKLNTSQLFDEFCDVYSDSGRLVSDFNFGFSLRDASVDDVDNILCTMDSVHRVAFVVMGWHFGITHTENPPEIVTWTPAKVAKAANV